MPPRENSSAVQPAAEAMRWPYLVAVLLLPLLVLWRRDNALYTPMWYADPWFYLGYFRDLLEFKGDLFEGSYYGSRLTWILPGWLLHSVLRPVLANAFLHLAVQTTATLSFFSILRQTAGARSAFLATLIFSANPWLWAATGWDYPDGAGIAYCLLAMALLTRAAGGRARRIALAMAGCAIAGMVYTHVFLASFTPLLLLYYTGLTWMWHRSSASRSILDWCGWAGLGFGIVTVALGIVNVRLDGHFWFYGPSITRALQMAKDFQFVRSIWVDGHALAPWLWPAAAGALTAAVALSSGLKKRSVALLFSLQLLLALAYTAYLQIRGTTVLGHHPYASYLLPFVFLVMGATFWTAADSVSLPAYLSMCGIAAAAFGALWFDPFSPLVAATKSAQLSAWILSVVCLGAALALRRRPAGMMLAIAGFVAFTSVQLGQTVHFQGLGLHGSRRQYERFMHLRERIEAVRQRRTPLFWFDRKEANRNEYVGLSSLYLAEVSQLSDTFPSGCDVPLVTGSLVIVLSQQEGAPELARSALDKCWSPLGIHPVLEGVEQVSDARRPYTLAMLRPEVRISSEADVLKTIALGEVTLGDNRAALRQDSDGLEVTAIPGFGAFAGRATLGLDASSDARLALHVKARAVRGKMGFGILRPDNKAFLQQRAMRPSAEMQDLILPIPVHAAIGDLIISNLSASGSVSQAVVEKIEILKMR